VFKAYDAPQEKICLAKALASPSLPTSNRLAQHASSPADAGLDFHGSIKAHCDLSILSNAENAKLRATNSKKLAAGSL
jgi:hypothetical protein